MNLNDVGALVAFGRVGVALAASRLMSLVTAFGTVGLGAYVIHFPSWEGVAVVALIAGCGLLPALQLERGRQPIVPATE